MTSEVLAATPSDLEAIRRRFNPYIWATETAKIRLPKTGELDFDAHPFMRDVYADIHPDITVIKGAQLGFSTWGMCRGFWALTNFALTAIYTFPNRDLVSEYTASRIDPIIIGTPYLHERIVDVNSVRLKKFSRSPRTAGVTDEGVSLVHFSGAAQEKDAISVDADLIIHDEEDKSNPLVISAYTTRMDHSKYKWRIRLSTPTIPEYGVDLSYQGTDRRKWLVTCPGCNAEFELRWPKQPGDPRGNVEPHTWPEVEAGTQPRFKCHRCHHTLADADRAGGKWQAMNPTTSGGRGYQISQMAAPWRTAGQLLLAQHEAKFPHLFWNLKIGIAWQSGTTQMTREALEARMIGPTMSRAGSGRFVGIDVQGENLEVVVEDYAEDGSPRIVAVESVPWHPDNDFSEADEILSRHGAVICVMDRQPQTGLADRFARRHNRAGVNRVYLARYRDETTTSRSGLAYSEPMKLFERNAEVATVVTPRDTTITAVVDELLGKMVLPAFDGSDEYESFILHCRNTKKRPVMEDAFTDESDITRYTWINTGPDDKFHAAVYAFLARNAPRPLVPALGGIYSMKRAERTKLSDFISQQEDLVTDAKPPRIRRQRMG